MKFDPKYAEKSQPSLEKVRELIGVDESVRVEFVAAIPCLYQGWEVDEWAFVVKDDAMNRYLLMSNHCRWYVGTEQELRDLVCLYAEAGQVAIKALIELTEGMQQDVAKLKGDAARKAGFTISQEEIQQNPALSRAVEGLLDAIKSTADKKKDGGDGKV